MGKKPERLSSALGALLKARGMQARLSEYRILGQWEKTVGRVIASHARPVTVRGARLFLTVDSAAWMQQLSMLRPEIIEKVNRALGRAAIREIALNLGEVPTGERSSEPPPVRAVLTAEERGRIEDTVAEIHDPDVRQALRRVMEKDLVSKKTKQAK
jgi:hypothetical protein